jgi:hypothetical protein
MNYLFTLRSKNPKTGEIPVTMSSRDTCPDVCPLKTTVDYEGIIMEGSCYGNGNPMIMHWDKLPSKDPARTSWDNIVHEVSMLGRGQLWRHNQVGDLPGENNAIDAVAMNKLIAANLGKRGFTYTHKPTTTENNRVIKRANRYGFTINLSGNNIQHADYLKSLNIAPVVCILPAADTAIKVQTSPAGHKIVTCPATYQKDVTCKNCGLCQHADRDYIIGFPAHGKSKKKAESL